MLLWRLSTTSFAAFDVITMEAESVIFGETGIVWAFQLYAYEAFYAELASAFDRSPNRARNNSLAWAYILPNIIVLRLLALPDKWVKRH